MSKKRILVSLLCLGAVLGVASCGTPEVTPTPTPTPPVTETPVTPTPTPEVVKYTVTFNSNGGSAVASAEVEQNKKVSAPANPTKEGYTFVGWFSDEALTKAWKFDSDVVTANTTLYAKWEEVVAPVEKFNVTYNANGHGEQPAEVTDVLALPAELPVLSAEGWTFLGWFMDENFSVAAVAGAELTADVVLYAKWEEKVAVQENAIEMNGVAYDTITAALAAIPTSGDTSTYTISLNKGTYKENGLSYNGTATIHIVGNTNTKYGTDVIIMGRGNNMGSMRGRELLEIQGTGSIILENISLVSDVSRSEGLAAAQAEVLGTDTKGNTVAYNCSFYSHQDTIRTAGKAWFYGCYVEGDTDFIWMEASGSVALYENCEIVSVYDEHATTHASYIAAPRMGVSSKVGKGLVFLNSVVRESAAAKENGQLTYLARSPWTSGYYNQVAYINTQISDVELEATSKAPNAPWYGNMIETEYPETVIGWKLDSKSAASLNLSDKDYILSDAVTGVEYNGRETILNRIYNTGKLKYEKDAANYWDIASLINTYKFDVTTDNSSSTLEGEVVAESTVYVFDGNTDYSSICNGFAQDQSKPHYAGKAGSTITIPVNGKSYVEVYGYYAGTAEVKADTAEGYALAFFNNGSTSTEIEYDYIVYDENAKSVVITAKATTYITKIVVTPDPTIGTASPVTEIEISRSTPVETVGVAVTLTAAVNKDASIKSVVWSSSDEEVASIDPFTGRITFKKAGTVTFTATACDGSGVTASIDCAPVEANWTVSEWYTTDNDVTTEEGAEGINNFAPGSESTYKGLTSSYSFTNLAGETITTSKGFKLNSKGQLSIAITKPAVLTLVVYENGNTVAVPVVSNGTVTVTPVSSTTSEDGKTYTHVYEINDIGMFDIVRGNNQSENNPLLYVKCEYVEPVISTSTGLTFKGSHYTESNTYIADIITPADTIDATGTTIYFDEFKLSNCKDNGKANWLVFKNDAKIEFKVSGACTVLVGYYSKLQTIKLNGVVVEGNKESVTSGKGEIVEYEITEAGTVTIEASQSDYLGFVGVLFKTFEMKKAGAIASLEAAYPAANYTQNADYATVLEAQKAAINAAADEAALKVAYDAAVVAMEALEVDKVEEKVDFTQNATIDLSATNGLKIEGSTGEYKGLTVDATNGKFADNGGGWVQVNAGTTISFNVAEGAEVSLVAYTSADNYTIAIANGVCTITCAANDYLKSISVKYKVVFNKTTTVDLSATDGLKIEGSVGEYEGLTVDATSGKFADNGGGWVQVNAGTIITLNVAENATVSLVAYTSADNYTIAIANGVCTITCAANDYLKSITVKVPVVYNESTKIDLSATGAKIEGSVGEYEGLTVDATSGKFADNNGGWVQVNTGTIITLNVAEGATVSVEAYTSADSFTVAVANGVCTITAVANDYLKSITVKVPYIFTETTTVDLSATDGLKIEGAVAEYEGLTVDATSGKLADNGGGWVQVNAGTIITLNVAENATVSLVAYTSADNYTIAIANGVCTITCTANDYLKSITVKVPVVYNESTKIDLSATGAKIEGSVGEYEGLTVDATSGKFADNNGGWVQVNAGTIITLNVAEGATVSVEAYTSADSFTVAVANGVCTITAVANDYLKSITVEIKEVVEAPKMQIDATLTKVEGAGIQIFLSDIPALTKEDITISVKSFTSTTYANYEEQILSSCALQEYNTVTGRVYATVSAGFPDGSDVVMVVSLSYTLNGVTYSQDLTFTGNAYTA